MTYGSGHNTIMQPPPPYLKFGTRDKKDPKKDPKKDLRKRKSRAFGGSVITLNSSGQIQITKP